MFRNWFFRQGDANEGPSKAIQTECRPLEPKQQCIGIGPPTYPDYEETVSYGAVEHTDLTGASPVLAAVDILFFAGATADCWPRGIVRGFVTNRAVVLEGKHKTLIIQGASIAEIKCDRRTDSIYIKRTGSDIVKLTGVRNAEQVVQALYNVI
jgi:hypothetical protein